MKAPIENEFMMAVMAVTRERYSMATSHGRYGLIYRLWSKHCAAF